MSLHNLTNEILERIRTANSAKDATQKEDSSLKLAGLAGLAVSENKQIKTLCECGYIPPFCSCGYYKFPG
jgi:hypothetical protein